ncbi:MAG: TM2 domain-containing protein [Saezia sp.]
MTNRIMLTPDEEDYVDQKVKRFGTTKLASYLFWFFFGIFGVHRFYNGAIKTGIAMAALHLIGLAIIITASFSMLFSVIDYSAMDECLHCVQGNPNDHEEICAQPYKKELEQNLQNQWGEDEPDVPVTAFTIGGTLWGASLLWWLVDAFLIPGLVRQANRKTRHKYIQDVLKHRRRQEQQQDQYDR